MAVSELDSGVFSTPSREILGVERPLDAFEQERYRILVTVLGEFPDQLPDDTHLADQFLPGAKIGPEYDPILEATAITREAAKDTDFGPLTAESTPAGESAYLHALTAEDTRRLIGMELADV